MCELCLHHPCMRGCPNETIETASICSRCRTDIEVGASYLDLDGRTICEECLEEMPTGELLSLFGYSLQTAEKAAV